MRMLYKISMGLLLACSVVLLAPALALAAAPASTHTMAAGPYIIDIKLYEDPPFVDKLDDIAVTPHDSKLQLQGKVRVEPGLGTNARPLEFKLAPANDNSGTLHGQFRMPVQGAWDVKVLLSGSDGVVYTATVPVVVAAPGAIPTWLGWLIGSSPLVFVAFWVWHQHRYRNKLVGEIE